jgi:N-methylhydantoinase A
MGGTTFKVGVVRAGRVEYQREAQVFRYHYALPKLDVVSLGLAGGSIISFDERTGTPQIGPRSAGSYPGPIIYGHGGLAPTVTDVDAILGFMNPRYFLGGRESLDIEPARAIFEQEIAGKLGLPLLEAAAAIYRLTNVYVFDLLHRTTVQRGLDPRRFILFSTGGTAGMHLPAIADELGVRGVVIPYSASVHGAFGLLISDVVHEEILTHPMRHPADPDAISELMVGLERKVYDQFTRDGFTPEDVVLTRSVDMRYRRQVHEVTVPLTGGGALSGESVARLAEEFAALYSERYGTESTFAGATLELVTFRVRGAARLARPALKRRQLVTTEAERAFVEERSVFLPEVARLITVRGYDLDRLGVGACIAGPALIWSSITTIVLGRKQAARLDAYRNLVIEQIAGAE